MKCLFIEINEKNTDSENDTFIHISHANNVSSFLVKKMELQILFA
jgi:hypothetical protein